MSRILKHNELMEFEVKNYDIVNAEQNHDGIFLIVYEGPKPSGSQIFDIKGYNPVDVGYKDGEVEVVFEKVFEKEAKKQNQISNLKKIASEISKFNVELSNEVLDASKRLVKASLMEIGDRIVCHDPVQPLLKGRLYVVGQKVKPNFNVILEEDGSPVGIFNINRFLIDWKSY